MGTGVLDTEYTPVVFEGEARKLQLTEPSSSLNKETAQVQTN